jgi:D-amino peptidase
MKKRNFHIRCDMEGVAGIVGMPQVTPGAPEYAQGREWFMAELLALVEGLLEGGAGDVSIYDEHWFGRNIDIARLPRGVRAFCGKPPYRADWAGGLDENCDGLILQGFHSMEGAGHLLSHTYEPDFKAIYITDVTQSVGPDLVSGRELPVWPPTQARPDTRSGPAKSCQSRDISYTNGKLVGEIGMETAIAGDFGVPLAMIVADSAGCDEARALVPGVVTVPVKISRAPFGGECFALDDVLGRVRAAAVALAQQPVAAAPWKTGPVGLECVFKPGPYLDALRAVAPEIFAGAGTIRLNAPTVTAAWADYWQLKLKAQAKL